MFVKPLPHDVTFSSWVLVDEGRLDLQRQCQNLVETLGMEPHLFPLRSHPMLSWIPRNLWGKWNFRGSPPLFLSPPWPDFVLGAGSLGTFAAGLVKRLSGGKTFSGCLSNPKTSLASFDFVITNLGDCLSDDRVIPCSGALSSITTQKLCKTSKDFIKTFSFLPHPRVAFFVGQASTEAKPSHGFIEKAAKDLKKLIDCTGGSLLILLPQNTKPSLVLEFETLLEGTPRFFWKHSSEDTPPYEAFLGTADYLIITGDSFPLLADALATEAPLYVYPPFSASPEYPLFCEHFFEKGLARPFEGTLDFWARPAFSETESVAHTLLKRFLKPS